LGIRLIQILAGEHLHDYSCQWSKMHIIQILKILGALENYSQIIDGGKQLLRLNTLTINTLIFYLTQHQYV